VKNQGQWMQNHLISLLIFFPSLFLFLQTINSKWYIYIYMYVLYFISASIFMLCDGKQAGPE
jgi:hypothetical protein